MGAVGHFVYLEKSFIRHFRQIESPFFNGYASLPSEATPTWLAALSGPNIINIIIRPIRSILFLSGLRQDYVIADTKMIVYYSNFYFKNVYLCLVG